MKIHRRGFLASLIASVAGLVLAPFRAAAAAPAAIPAPLKTAPPPSDYYRLPVWYLVGKIGPWSLMTSRPLEQFYDEWANRVSWVVLSGTRVRLSFRNYEIVEMTSPHYNVVLGSLSPAPDAIGKLCLCCAESEPCAAAERLYVTDVNVHHAIDYLSASSPETIRLISEMPYDLFRELVADPVGSLLVRRMSPYGESRIREMYRQAWYVQQLRKFNEEITNRYT